MFSRLRVKLTVLYSGLFAAILLLISLAVYSAIAQVVQRQVREELATSATVFDRVWALRTDQLENGAWLLSRDYGFRQAIATNDATTISSALDNLRLRLGLDVALLIGVDGKVTAAGAPQAGMLSPAVLQAVQTEDAASGVLELGDQSFQVVSVPARAPTTIGWVVFASKLDSRQLRALERLAAIPLNASVLHRTGQGPWRNGDRAVAGLEQRQLGQLLKGASNGRPHPLSGSNGGAVALVKPLNSLDPGSSAVLLLQYPLDRALAPYRLLTFAFVGISAVGLLALLAGSWWIARGVTRPISALEEAARRFKAGERVEVAVETRDEVGALARSFNAMARNIWRREQELKSTKAFLDTVVENLPAMLVVKDKDHKFVLLNRTGEALLGVDRKDVIGKTDHDLFPKDQADFFVERDKDALRSGQLQLIADEPIMTPMGVRYLQTKKIAIPDLDGQPQYLLAICEDITERKVADAALERARMAAEAANRAKSSFLANMSHEVRTPLNGVLGVASVLAKTELMPKQQQMVGIIEKSAAALQRVLNDVLDMAKVEAGRLQILEEDFDLETAVQAAASPIALHCAARSLRFQLHYETTRTARVWGDRVRLEQVLGNLLSNALKFTTAGEVRLAVRDAGPDGPLICFEVTDTGIGFAQDRIEELFSPFHQADGSDTRSVGGAGLGLSISRELARAMGGDLTAAGSPGAGATFTLTLPLPPAEAAAAPPAQIDLAPPSSDNDAAQPTPHAEEPLRVLLADDHETNRTVVRLILDSVGADLVSVENGAEAVEVFQADRFDIVLMDLQMPVMDGLTAIRRIREGEALNHAARTPILVVSANAMAEHLDASAAAGADGHLAKPVTAQALIAALEAALLSQAAAVDERAAGGR